MPVIVISIIKSDCSIVKSVFLKYDTTIRQSWEDFITLKPLGVTKLKK